MLKKKSIKELDNRIGDVIHKFSIQNKLKLIGSNSFKGMLFGSDYDIDSKLTEPAEVLAEHFKKLFSKQVPFYLMDFKAGLYKGEKLRWNKEQLAKGINKGIKLSEAIKMDTIIKLDMIIPVGDTFAEASEIYETKYQTKKSREEIEKELETEVEIYIKEGNQMKALKRLFSLLSLDKGHTKVKKELINFFNSEIGMANKCANDLELLLLLCNKYDVPFDKIYNNVQMIKEQISKTFINPLELNKINKTNYKKTIDKEIKHIRSKIKPLCVALLSKYKNLI